MYTYTMKQRISRVVTCTGDDGNTSMADGSRISKNHSMIHAIGEIDELNSSIGLLICELKDSKLQEGAPKIIAYLTEIQHTLFNIGGELSMPQSNLINENQVTEMTELIKDLNKDLPPLREFILPGGSKCSSLAHISRTITRRAERNIVGLQESGQSELPEINSFIQPYVNRLSDFFFVLSRVLNKLENKENTYWKKNKNN